MLDIGGESSRPGAQPVSAADEIARVRPVLEAALGLGCPISIDTAKTDVMGAALDLGVDIVNDISALRAPGALARVAADSRCGVCLTHMKGEPRSMQAEARYGDVVGEVGAFLRERIDAATAAGIGRERLVVDPGIGFAKLSAHNLALLERQEDLLALGVPLLVGWSRKSTLPASPAWPRPRRPVARRRSAPASTRRASSPQSSRCSAALASCACTTSLRRSPVSPSGRPREASIIAAIWRPRSFPFDEENLLRHRRHPRHGR